jgi:hypothetical protein
MASRCHLAHRNLQRASIYDLDELETFYHRCNPDAPVLRRDMHRWGRGSAWCNLTDEQYARLEHAHSRGRRQKHPSSGR